MINKKAMREILFKAKSADTNEWLYGNLVDSGDSPSGKSYYILPSDATAYDEVEEVDANTICQYIGLNDKKTKKLTEGNKIFEGDIVKYHKNTGKWLISLTGEIIFEGGAFYLYWEREMLGNQEIHKDLLTRYDRRYMKVIGNKYDGDL